MHPLLSLFFLTPLLHCHQNWIHSESQQQASDSQKRFSDWIRGFSRCLYMKPLMSALLEYSSIVAFPCSVSLCSVIRCRCRDVVLFICKSWKKSVWLASCRDKYLSLLGVSLKDNNQQCLKKYIHPLHAKKCFIIHFLVASQFRIWVKNLSYHSADGMFSRWFEGSLTILKIASEKL